MHVVEVPSSKWHRPRIRNIHTFRFDLHHQLLAELIFCFGRNVFFWIGQLDDSDVNSIEVDLGDRVGEEDASQGDGLITEDGIVPSSSADCIAMVRDQKTRPLGSDHGIGLVWDCWSYHILEGLSQGSVLIDEDFSPMILPEDVVAQNVVVGYLVEFCCFATRHPQLHRVAFRTRLKGSHSGTEVIESNVVESQPICPRSNDTSSIVVGNIHIGRCIASGIADHQTIVSCNIFDSFVGFMELNTTLPTVSSSKVSDGGVSQVFTQEPAFFISPQGVVLEHIFIGNISHIRILKAGIFGWEAWEFGSC